MKGTRTACDRREKERSRKKRKGWSAFSEISEEGNEPTSTASLRLNEAEYRAKRSTKEYSSSSYSCRDDNVVDNPWCSDGTSISTCGRSTLYCSRNERHPQLPTVPSCCLLEARPDTGFRVRVGSGLHTSSHFLCMGIGTDRIDRLDSDMLLAKVSMPPESILRVRREYTLRIPQRCNILGHLCQEELQFPPCFLVGTPLDSWSDWCEHVARDALAFLFSTQRGF